MAERHAVERYVGECFIKCAHVILSSRILAPANAAEFAPNKSQRSNHWFQIEVEGVERAKLELEPWRRDLNHPLVIEVFARLWGPTTVALNSQGSSEHGRTEMLLERWVLQYCNKGQQSAPANSYGNGYNGTSGSTVLANFPSSSRTYMDESSIYKRMIILVRSLHSHSRVLPAYRMYRACKRTKGEQFVIAYRILHNMPSSAADQDQMSSFRHYDFAPVETPSGSFKISLEYAAPETVSVLEKALTVPIATSMPRIIPDYVGRHGSSTQKSIITTQVDRGSGPSQPRVNSGTTGITSPMGSSPTAPATSASAPANSGTKGVAGFMGSVGSTLMGMMPSSYIRQAAKVGIAVIDSSTGRSGSFTGYRRGHSLNSRAAERSGSMKQLLTTNSMMVMRPGAENGRGCNTFETGSWTGDGRQQPGTVTRHCWSSKDMSIILPATGNRPIDAGRDPHLSPSPSGLTSIMEHHHEGSPPSSSPKETNRTSSDCKDNKPQALPIKGSKPTSRARSVTDMQVIYDFPDGLQGLQLVSGSNAAQAMNVKTGAMASHAAHAYVVAPSSAPPGPRGMLGLALQHEASHQRQQHTDHQEGVMASSASGRLADKVDQPLDPCNASSLLSSSQPSSLEAVQEDPEHHRSHSLVVTRQQQQQQRIGVRVAPLKQQQLHGPDRETSVSVGQNSVGGSHGAGSSACAVAISCSPQLPFAFTPSGQSLSSLKQHFGVGRPYNSHERSKGPEVSSGDLMANPSFGSSTGSSPNHRRRYPEDLLLGGGELVGVSGRDISALATIRRPSWSLSYSSSLDRVAPWMLPHFGGISPMQDASDGSASMSMMSSLATPSQHRQYMVPLGVGVGVAGGLLALPPATDSEACVSATSQSPVKEAVDVEAEVSAVNNTSSLLNGLDESDSDLLPFALEEESMEVPGPVRSITQPTASGFVHGCGVGDVAVGAFIRMLQEFPQCELPGKSEAPSGSNCEAGTGDCTTNPCHSLLDPSSELDLKTAVGRLRDSAARLKSYLSSTST